MRWNPDVCRRGHRLTTLNTYQRPGGPRECRECRKEAHRHQWLTRDERPKRESKPRAERKVERVVVEFPDYEEMPIGSVADHNESSKMAAAGSVDRAHQPPSPEPCKEAHVAPEILPQPFAVDRCGVLYYLIGTGHRAPAGMTWVQP